MYIIFFRLVSYHNPNWLGLVSKLKIKFVSSRTKCVCMCVCRSSFKHTSTDRWNKGVYVPERPATSKAIRQSTEALWLCACMQRARCERCVSVSVCVLRG